VVPIVRTFQENVPGSSGRVTRSCGLRLPVTQSVLNELSSSRQSDHASQIVFPRAFRAKCSERVSVGVCKVQTFAFDCLMCEFHGNGSVNPGTNIVSMQQADYYAETCTIYFQHSTQRQYFRFILCAKFVPAGETVDGTRIEHAKELHLTAF
jgi:hypothetical protein